MKVPLTLTVNGVAYPLELEPATTSYAVRDGLTGAKEGCDDSECGACMMLLDGKPVNRAPTSPSRRRGEVTTVEGLADGADLSPLQRAFLERGGVQCGFCTGMLISATVASEPRPTEDEVRSRCRATSAAAPATTGS